MSEACLTVDQIARYVSDSVATTDRTAHIEHVERCEPCRAAIGAAVRANRSTDRTSADVDALEVGAQVGRFIIARVLGVGGLGRVYAAYDPQLDRTIALKLLRDPQFESEEALARLTREAQLTARLTHPNVVAIHDVGTFGTHVFIAMELVEGETLRGWVEREPRSWRDVVAMFRQAGEGIAAAHAAGLVHRDIKPDNVLVGHDGRARITDFGLARIAGEALGEEAGVVGTPAYMAPEQLRGRTADARSDQFSFCVALYEALYRERPFAGATLADRLRAIEAGELRPPAQVRVPGRLRRVVVRGLAANPRERYPSIRALLAELAIDPGARIRRVAVAAAFVAVATTGTALAWTRDRGEPPCQASATQIASAWNPQQRQALERAFRATGRPFAEQAIASVEAALDGYVQRWTAAHTDACKATHVRHDQSAALLDRRNVCLEERRAALAAQVSLFATADAALVDRAVKLAADLPRIEACSDSKALLALVPLPVDAAQRARVQELRGQLAAAAVEQRSARYPAARAALDALRGPITSAGYPPLTASFHELEGIIAEELRETKPAIDAFDRAALAAETGGDDLAKARALLGGARVRGLANIEPELVAKLFEQSRAALGRAGGAADVELRIELSRASIAVITGAFDDAVTHDRAALALAERHFGPNDFRTASVRAELAIALERTGKYDEAERLAIAAVDGLSRAFGDGHPRTSAARAIWAQILYDEAKYDEALVQQARVLADREAVFGKDAGDLWTVLSDMARSYEGKAQFDKALALFERAKTLVDRLHGTKHPNAALIRVNVASAQLELKRHDEAVATFRDAIAVAREAAGPDNIFEANAQNGIAQAWRVSHPQDALKAADESLRLFRKLEGDEHPDVARGHDTRGRILDQLNRRGEAIAAFEKALAMREAMLGADHPDTADTRFTLATVLYRSGQRARAIELARAAERAFTAAGDQVNAKTIAGWLARAQ